MRACDRLGVLMVPLLLVTVLSACAQPDAPVTPVPQLGPSQTESKIDDPDELIWFGEAPDPSRDPADAELILDISELEEEPDDLDPESMLPPLGGEEGWGHGVALDPEGGLGEWTPQTPICDMFPLAEWRDWTGDPAAFSLVLAEGEECGYFTSADMRRMMVRFELDSLMRADDTGMAEWTELEFPAIPAFWQQGHPRPYAGTFVATIEGMTVSASVFSRDPALTVAEWRAFAERVVTQTWWQLF